MHPDPPTGRPLRVALYARVSTRDKDQDPELQLVPLREYVVSRGWVASEYVDEVSAADLVRRTAWHRLLEDARRRRVDRVMVWKLDRAFRSTLHALRTLEEFDGWGVGFACLTQELDTTSPTGRLVFTVLAAVAEMERSLIADRVREGMAHARRQGKQIGRPRVESRRGFRARWAGVEPQVRSGALSRRAAAAQLGVGQGTLARLLAEKANKVAPLQMAVDPNGSFEANR
ncbi:MAG: recombinase family protein [Candidatus Dormibacteria bacterium]